MSTTACQPSVLNIVAHSTSCPRQSDTTPDSAFDHVPATFAVVSSRWYSTVWRDFCGALLHTQQYLVWPSLLHVRLLILVLRYHDSYLRCGDNSACLLPSVRRELPLAMESVPGSWS